MIENIFEDLPEENSSNYFSQSLEDLIETLEDYIFMKEKGYYDVGESDIYELKRAICIKERTPKIENIKNRNKGMSL